MKAHMQRDRLHWTQIPLQGIAKTFKEKLMLPLGSQAKINYTFPSSRSLFCSFGSQVGSRGRGLCLGE